MNCGESPTLRNNNVPHALAYPMASHGACARYRIQWGFASSGGGCRKRRQAMVSRRAFRISSFVVIVLIFAAKACC
ncbi:MAG TPA: hypothetical protein VF343_07255, partial [Syntrophales bacterium]